jgi:hypothetical protein
MSRAQIAVVNRSQTLSDSAIEPVVAALQKHVSNEFAAAWGIDAELSFVGSNAQPGPGLWWLVILDNSDQAGALGYHDLTDEGFPMGKVFAQTDAQYKSSFSVTASHELLEMLVDPDINLCAIDQNLPNVARLYAYEVCDACEADQLGYQIDGVLVSDFVHPSWFESFWQSAQSRPKFDQQGVIDAPFALQPGGYISVMDVASVRGWVQIFGDGGPSAANRAKVGSRRERRRTPRAQWLRSASANGAARV